jgi:hypothetical protein
MATYIQIGSTVTVGSGGAADITFSSIPAIYTDLVLKVSARTNRSGQPNDDILVQVNGNTSAIYSQRRVIANGSTVFSDSSSGSSVGVSIADGPTATASVFGNAELYFPNYAGSENKSMSADGVAENNATASWAGFNAFLASTTTAISSITLKSLLGTSFDQYTTATLYGISKS